MILGKNAAGGWQSIEFRPGKSGRAICESLGLNPNKVAAEPIEVLVGKNRVHIKYVALATTTPADILERLRKMAQQ